MNIPSLTCESRGEICVAIRQCQFFDDLLNKSSIPRSRSVIKMIRENQCGFNGKMPYVCCQRPTLPPESSTEATTVTPPLLDTLTDIRNRHTNFNLLPDNICGPISTDSRITFGKKTAISEYPWMALIAYYTSRSCFYLRRYD
ncbi:hypothetical protein NQ314_007425 [Rhamnusium bicolor]|uniref:Clip domain-containing protein n=1 Tax=Rhamnusium bicolor TaxID=1586634 RepID=A0AAV8YP30_9CUCU|nr:hypothetical protein NQ314_007425 [Rhamnusium bicolor]